MAIVLTKKTKNVKSFINSEQAKSEMRKHVAKVNKAKALQEHSPLKDRAALKGFWKQHPKTRDLFGQIVIVCRQSTARRPGAKGFWAAYPYPWWSEKAGMPVATLKRHLKLLEEHGLIERQLGKHGGTRVLTFIRPTALAFELSDTRPGDEERILGLKEGIKPKPAAPAYVTPLEKALTDAKLYAELDDGDKKPTKEELLALIWGKPDSSETASD